MKTKLLLLLTLLFVMVAQAQVNLPPPTTSSFAFNVSPTQGSAVVDKYAGGYQQITWPIVVALPPGTTGARSYSVTTPLNFQNNLMTFSPNFGTLNAGQSVNVFMTVNTNILSIGQFYVPIMVKDLNNGYSVNLQVTLTVADLRTLTIPPDTTRTVPHLASGAGWRTILQFTNPSNITSVIQVDLFNPAGIATAFRLRDGRFSSMIQEVVPGYGTVNVVLEDSVTTQALTGSAEIKPLWNSPVGVTVMYEMTDAAAHIASIQATAVTKDTLTLFYDNTNGRVTGLALLNSLNYPQLVALTYYDDGGSVLATSTLTLAAKGQTSFVVTDPAIVNRAGVMRVTAPLPTLTGFALRFNKDMQFTPVMPF